MSGDYIDLGIDTGPRPRPTPPAPVIVPGPTPAPPGPRAIVIHLPQINFYAFYAGFVTVALALVLLWPYLHLPEHHPKPPPGPTPTKAALHASLVYDTTKQDQMLMVARLRSDAQLREDLAALGCKWRDLDVNEPITASANLKGYVAAAGGPPVLIVQAEGIGKPIETVKGKFDGAEILALVKRIRGQ